MTCVSERSGMASSGVCRIARSPATVATSTSAIVTTRFRAHHVMSRSIMAVLPLGGRGAKPRLGRHEEVARGDHHIPFAKSADDFVPVARLRPQRDLARRQASLADIDEDDPPIARVEDRAL